MWWQAGLHTTHHGQCTVQRTWWHNMEKYWEILQNLDVT